ncbi:hypothetical protein NRB16_21785 [Pseudomonas sp. LJDD11]|nr:MULTISPECIES: hypothetical protein [unclassified Pseudomonas]MCQ9426155.1 hypothetical protein [Pseudomonas sp. LJDD11]
MEISLMNASLASVERMTGNGQQFEGRYPASGARKGKHILV